MLFLIIAVLSFLAALAAIRARDLEMLDLASFGFLLAIVVGLLVSPKLGFKHHDNSGAGSFYGIYLTMVLFVPIALLVLYHRVTIESNGWPGRIIRVLSVPAAFGLFVEAVVSFAYWLAAPVAALHGWRYRTPTSRHYVHYGLLSILMFPMWILMPIVLTKLHSQLKHSMAIAQHNRRR